MSELICNVPFCNNSKKNTKSAYCGSHEWERTKYKVKAYKELLPLWAVKRCKVHGLIRQNQCYKILNSNRYRCKLCKYHNSYKPTDKNKKYRQEQFLVKRYGINKQQYETILLYQNNVCAICKSINLNIDSRTGLNRKMAVDHCHSSGKVRGILCYQCNMGLGNFKDEPFILENALNYLRSHK